MNLVRKQESLRSLSQIFTSSNFRKIVRNCEDDLTRAKIQKHLSNSEARKFISIIKFLYKQLESNYRNEYIYKNALLNQELLRKHSLETTTVLNEFKIGSSIADFVLLNGEIRIFEIKTDLDGFDKLEKQIDDYQKFAEKIFVVVSSKTSERILDKYNNSSVGVIEFTENNILKTLKPATTFTDRLDHTVIFKTLRQGEYLEIVKKYFGCIPKVPNTLLFKECLDLLKGIDVKKFQSLTRKKLKQRNLKCPEHLKSKDTPKELKHICYTLNLTDSEYKTLHVFLNTKI